MLQIKVQKLHFLPEKTKWFSLWNTTLKKCKRPLQIGVQCHLNQESHLQCPTGPCWSPAHPRGHKNKEYKFTLLGENPCHSCIYNSSTTHPHIKDTAGISDSLGVGLWISAATANMEADADHIQAQFFSPLQKTSTSFEWCPKLDTQATHCLRVISGNTEH